MQAHYSLSEVVRLIGQNKFECGYTRAIKSVVDVFATTNTPKSQEEARQFIADGLKTLTPHDFFESQFQNDITVDKYGIIFAERPWFIKFYIANDFLEELSFHPPKDSFKTVGEKKIPKGGQYG
jgi:hypothetical protein